jgi:DNA-binding transcriptional ArsR family regulator
MDEMTVESPQQHKALAHPMRHRLLFAIGQEPATVSQLAVSLNANKGSVAHHLKVLADAGLVVVDGTRQVRGGTEIYYRRAAERLRYPIGESTGIGLAAVADEIVANDPDPLLILRHVRLTAVQAAHVTEVLRDLVEGLTEAGHAEPRYGVLVGLYRADSTPNAPIASHA